MGDEEKLPLCLHNLEQSPSEGALKKGGTYWPLDYRIEVRQMQKGQTKIPPYPLPTPKYSNKYLTSYNTPLNYITNPGIAKMDWIKMEIGFAGITPPLPSPLTAIYLEGVCPESWSPPILSPIHDSWHNVILSSSNERYRVCSEYSISIFYLFHLMMIREKWS